MREAALRSPWARWAAFIAVALIGLAVRLPHLGARPMHTDEAVNAYIVGQVLSGEPFHYDPQDRHGPALAALAVPLARIQGAKSFANLTEAELRISSVVGGTLTILLFGAAVEIFGFVPSLIAALLFAVAPLPVYYDRYFVHESLFCAATFALILSGWRALNARSVGYAALAGAVGGLMLACKETATLQFIAMTAAVLVYRRWSLRGERLRTSFPLKQLLVALGTFVAVVTIFFSWFGRDWKGIDALFRAVPPAFARAGGQGHEKPFWYYGQLLTGGWSGAMLVGLAVLGVVLTINKRGKGPYQSLAVYGLFVAAIYSLIPYKTPWLALNLWLPLAIFASKAIEWLWHWAGAEARRSLMVPAFCIMCLAACIAIAHDTRFRVFIHSFDESNPYAYAHTSDDIVGLPSEIADLAHQRGIATPRITVIASDPWPLPWYLRRFNQVGFWQPGQQVAEADFYVTSTDVAEQYANQLRDFRPEFFGVRPGVLILLWSPAPR